MCPFPRFSNEPKSGIFVPGCARFKIDAERVPCILACYALCDIVAGSSPEHRAQIFKIVGVKFYYIFLSIKLLERDFE